MPVLPDFVPPMLAKRGSAFDSDEHLFEIKWDGTRALSFVEAGRLSMKNRYGEDLGQRFPELGFLRELPPGTVLDGELVVLRDGAVDFSLAMSRVHARGARRIDAMSRTTPATYALFDLLYEDGRSLLDEPLSTRRERLEALLAAAPNDALLFSQGIVGGGVHYFEEVVERGFEGVVAKRLSSRYESDRRSGAWTKCKRTEQLLCAIVGYVPEGERDMKSLVIAASDSGSGGALRCVGKVGSGLSSVMRTTLVARLADHRQDQPIVECPFDAQWVEPALFCAVSFLERTEGGMLRAPVFVGLVEST